ncbi:MAG: sel1 repeat family protein [Desulfobacterales bacterium]|nr:sel1 repeat family protein [Desulfofustis sp.]NNK95560.1 sel1 repeat family protein [Desulfobacterales bacterium]
MKRYLITAPLCLFLSLPLLADNLTHWQKRAEKGNINAQFNLGAMYDSGDGVSEDDAEAANWYRKAADQGHVNAQFNLGVMYANGEGVAENATEAANWYRKAADQGDYRAQYNLGVLYANGEGVPQSNSESYVWISIAVMSGHNNLVPKRDRAAEKLSKADLDLAQQRASTLFEEIQQSE